MKAQIVAKTPLVPVKVKGTRFPNQLRYLSRSEQAEKYHDVNKVNFEGYICLIAVKENLNFYKFQVKQLLLQNPLIQKIIQRYLAIRKNSIF